MLRKLFCITVLFVFVASTIFAQNIKKTGIIKGKLINKNTKAPFNDVRLLLKDLDVFTSSNGEGQFEFSEVPFGNRSILIVGNSVVNDTVNILVDKDIVETGNILVTPNENNASLENIEIPTIAIEESNTSTEDEGVTLANATGMIGAGRDPFTSTAAFVFGAYWFQPRGVQRNTNEVLVNGIPINDMETGTASWGQLGGLNDVFRNRNLTYGLAPSNYSFGGIGGSTYYDATAADQRKETVVTYTNTDRNYSNRVMVTENTGVMKNGWAFSGSFSKRWAEQGYIPGTFYDGYSYYAAASKIIGKGQLNITTFGAPTIHGKGGSATAEVFALDNSHYYNHNWGYQNGQIRNAAVQNVFQPISIVNYEYKPNEKTRWNTAVAYEFGKDKSSSINSNNAPSPYGDYYRLMPSYYLNMVPPNPFTAANMKTAILNNPNSLQIDWNNLYQSNYTNSQSIYDANGIAGNTVTGKRSMYILGNRVNDLKKYTFSTNIERSVNQRLTLTGGLTFIGQTTETYNQIADLLGGDFYVDNNQYAPTTSVINQNYTYNNLLAPNAILKVGDKINYDYTIHFYNTNLWGQAVYTFNKFDAFIAATGGDYSFQREGLFKNGVFANNSYGLSSMHNFMTYGVKGGVDFKFDGRNVLFLNAAYSGTPPTPDNTYISMATRDYTIANPTVQTNKSLEGGYYLKGQNISARVVGYVTDETNTASIKRFYNDDPAYYTFVNYVMQGANTRSIGTEIALNYKIFRAFSVTGVAAIGQAFYTNEPNVSIYLDNDTTVHAITSKAYIKNYYLSTGPQSAYTLGLRYSPRGWSVNLNFNYFDRNYVSINPNRRTTDAAGFVTSGTTQWHQIFDQEKLPSFYTVDLHAGYNVQLSRKFKQVSKISKNSSLYISLGVNNLLNNTNIINFGYEQLRFDYLYNNPAKFPNKYIYGMGINYFLNIALRF